MRASLWFFGISAVALLEAGGISAGCGSSSSQPGVVAPPDASPPRPADAGCYVDASLTMFAASDAAGAGCAACVNTMCGSAVTSCATDCTCISLFECLLDAGYSATDFQTSLINAISGCVPGGLTAAGDLLHDQAVKSVYNCFAVTCLPECSLPLDGGDAAAASSVDGEAEGDAGPAADAADGGAAGEAGPSPEAGGSD